MEATVTLVEGMQFAVNMGSGHAFIIDALPAVGGNDTGPRPMELMVASVAGCTAMDVISILRKMREKVTRLKVSVNAERAEEHPKKILSIHVNYMVAGHGLSQEKVQQAVQLSETRYCSAMATLREVVQITSGLTINEAE